MFVKVVFLSLRVCCRWVGACQLVHRQVPLLTGSLEAGALHTCMPYTGELYIFSEVNFTLYSEVT